MTFKLATLYFGLTLEMFLLDNICQCHSLLDQVKLIVVDYNLNPGVPVCAPWPCAESGVGMQG